jgi:hypothetical protein
MFSIVEESEVVSDGTQRRSARVLTWMWFLGFIQIPIGNVVFSVLSDCRKYATPVIKSQSP